MFFESNASADSKSTNPKLISECQISEEQDRSKSFLEFLSCEQNKNYDPVFPTYRISNFPIVLVDLKNSNSATLVQNGNVLEIFQVNSPIIIRNSLYEFHDSTQSGMNLNTVLNPVLEKWKIRQAMIWNIGIDFNLRGTPIEDWGLRLHFAIMTHEGFHFFGQQLNQIPITWPKEYLGLSDQTRNAIQSLCYSKTDAVKKLVQRQRKSLLAAVGNVFANSIDNAVLDISEYLELKQQRYQLLSGIRFFDSNLKKEISCEEAENFAAIVEGIPEFIGVSSLLRLQMLTPEQVEKYFPENDNAFIYRFSLFEGLVFTSVNSKAVSIMEAVQNIELGTSGALRKWLELNK